MKVSLARVSPGSLSKLCMLASLAFWLPVALVAGLLAFADPPHASRGGSELSWGVAAFVASLIGGMVAALVNGSLLFAGAMLLRLMGRRAPSLLISPVRKEGLCRDPEAIGR